MVVFLVPAKQRPRSAAAVARMPDDESDALATETSRTFASGDIKQTLQLLAKVKASPGRENGT